MKCYEEAINETSKDNAPWYVIPADDKWFARVAAIQIIIDALEKMNLKFPKLSEEDKLSLEEAKKTIGKRKINWDGRWEPEDGSFCTIILNFELPASNFQLKKTTRKSVSRILFFQRSACYLSASCIAAKL